MQKNKVLQTKMKVLRKINVLFVIKNKELQKKKFCKKKISFANKNNELQKKIKYCKKKISFANKNKE